MGAIEEKRKAVQNSFAPEIRTLSVKMEALVEEQSRLRAEIGASEERLSGTVGQTRVGLRAELIASETRVTAAIDRLRADLPLLV